MAFPQDYAAMMTMIEKLQQIPKVVGIDIGGFTTDYLLMRKGNPDMEACDSMEKGVITMYNKIISGINSEYDILLEESDIDSILQGNTEFYEEYCSPYDRRYGAGFCKRSAEQYSRKRYRYQSSIYGIYWRRGKAIEPFSGTIRPSGEIYLY